MNSFIASITQSTSPSFTSFPISIKGSLSGAGFLKVPKNLGNFIQKKDTKDYPGGMLELIHGSKAFLSNAKFRIKPEIGDFYFFPNYLMHIVYPFYRKDEERRSISFNALIDENIYNSF